MVSDLFSFFKTLNFKWKKIIVKIERPRIEKLNDSQEKALKIVNKILTDPETELRTNPLENKLYLKKVDDSINIFVTIEYVERGYVITMIGKIFIGKKTERFSYEVFLPPIVGKKLINKFYKILKRSVNKMELDITKENRDNLSELVHILGD